MSYVSTSRKRLADGWRLQRALTIVEMLVAVLIVAAIMGSAIVAFVYLVRGSEEMQIRFDAVSNARHALAQLTTDLSQAMYGPAGAMPPDFFIGNSVPQAFGNGKDDDHDGRTDEEVFNGFDDDGDWTLADDRHAEISTTQTERQWFVGRADFGDAHVDEDTSFSLTDLRFRISETSGFQTLHYYVGTFEGMEHVLIREAITTTGTLASPVAFNVLSFGTLYWDPNAPQSPAGYWKTSWNSELTTTTPKLPKSVAIELTIYAGRQPLSLLLSEGSPLDTIMLTTVVNIQQTLINMTP